jgi:hypothetical protein
VAHIYNRRRQVSGEILQETLPQKHSTQKKGWQSEALSSNPSTTKKKKKIGNKK